MNKASSPVLRILRAEKSDENRLRDYIKLEWGAHHPFTTNSDLFKWQYLNGEHFNIYIAENQNDKKIVGFLGYIPTSRYDETLVEQSACLWWALWKVSKHYASHGLGIGLMAKIVSEFKTARIGVVGINAEVGKIYEKLGYTVGEMDHFFQVNPDINALKMIQADEASESPSTNTKENGNCSIRTFASNELDLLTFLELQDKRNFAKKTPSYLNARYGCHPFYTYEIHGIVRGNVIVSLFVTRVAIAGPVKALRIIDFIGDDKPIGEVGRGLRKLTVERNCEYIDFVCHGFDRRTMEAAGFTKLVPSGKTIVPNLLEPLIEKNIPLKFALKLNSDEDVRLVRGDGDQDRGNYLVSNYA